METVELLANLRTSFTKSARSSLRKSSRIPGILYGKSIQPVAFDVAENALNPLVFTAEAHVINLKLSDDTQHDCIIKDVQFHPVTDKVIHVDVIELVKGEKIELEAPILYVGTPIGLRDGGQLQELLHKLNIRCLPKDIPETLSINIADLKIGQSIHVSELNFENIEILNTPEAVVVAVAAPRIVKEVEADADEIKEPEVIHKGKEKE